MDTCHLTVAAVSVLALTRENWLRPATPAEGCCGQSHPANGHLGTATLHARAMNAQNTGQFLKE